MLTGLRQISGIAHTCYVIRSALIESSRYRRIRKRRRYGPVASGAPRAPRAPRSRHRNLSCQRSRYVLYCSRCLSSKQEHAPFLNRRASAHRKTSRPVRRAGPPRARAEGQKEGARRRFFRLPRRRAGRRQTMPANKTAIAASLDRATRLPVATLREGPTIGSCPPPRAASLCQRTSLITLDQRLEAERSGATEAKRRTSPRSPSRAFAGAMEMAPQMLDKAQSGDGNGRAAVRESDDAVGVRWNRQAGGA